MKHEKASVYYGIAMSIVAILAIGYGVSYIETPAGVRDMRIDEQQIMDLQTIQYQIENYYTLNKELPNNLTDIKTGPRLPEAAEREAYSYEKTELGFNLCATFARESQPQEFGWIPPIDDTAFIKNRDDWSHGEGRYCFERVVSKQQSASVELNFID